MRRAVTDHQWILITSLLTKVSEIYRKIYRMPSGTILTNAARKRGLYTKMALRAAGISDDQFVLFSKEASATAALKFCSMQPRIYQMVVYYIHGRRFAR